MYVFGLMIPLGLLLLVLSIKHIVKVYTVTAIHDMPYRTDKGIFTIQTAGRYGIWLNGNRFKKAPLGLFGLQLINCETEKEVPLRANLIPVSVTKVIDVRFELYTFYAKPGTYQIVFNDNPSPMAKIFGTISRFLMGGKEDYGSYSIRIYPHQSMIYSFLSIWGFIFGVMAVMWGIAGLVIH